MTRQIVRRMRRSGDVAERAAWLVANHLRHVQAREMRVATLRRFLGEPMVRELLELVRIDALSGSGDLSSCGTSAKLRVARRRGCEVVT